MNRNVSPILRDHRLVAAFFILVLANLLIGSATTSLWDQDEAAYAGFAKTMLEQNEWVVPQFPYSHPHRKVPLTFWMIAASFATFGVSEFALRLPSMLAIVTTAACVWLGGRFILGRGMAKLAAMILISSLFVLNLGKIALTDDVLLACETIAALALLRGVVRPSWKATVVLWTAVAVGALAKGPPIFILVGGMFLFLLIFYPRRRNLVSLHPWFGLPLALLPLAVWTVLAWREDSRFVVFLVHWYVLRRLGGSVYGQAGLPGTYFLLFFVCLIPWTGYLLTALADAWKGIRKRRVALLLVGSWLFGGWVIWELPLSKLPTYTLGAFPALALILARQVHLNVAGRTSWETRKSLRVGFRALVVVCIGLAGAVIGIGVWVGALWSKVLVILPAAALVVTGLLALRFQERAAPLASVKTLLLGGLVSNLLLWLVFIPGLEPRRSVTLQVAETVAAQCPPGTTVVVAKRVLSPSLPFYVQQASLHFRDVMHSDTPLPPLQLDWSLLWNLKLRELAQQIEAQTPRKLPDKEDRQLRLERVADLYRSGEPLALILDEEQYTALQDQLADARVIRIDGWLADRFEGTTYIIVISPAALSVRNPNSEQGGPLRPEREADR